MFAKVSMRRLAPPLAVAALAAFGPGESRGDRIVMRGGGSVAGKVIVDPERPDEVLVLMERGRNPLKLRKGQVLEVIPEPGPLDGYLARKPDAPETAQGQHELGLWCEENGLRDLANVHYEAAVGLDPSFGPAHRKLGHQEVNGVWLSGDQIKEAQGLVKHRGRWMTPEDRDAAEQGTASAVEHAEWVRRIQGLREAILFGAEARRREADAELMAIHDPAAVGPLVRVLSDDDAAIRIRLARVLGAVPGEEATRALVHLLISEGSADVRGALMNALKGRDDPEAISGLVKALKSTDPAVVNRAAWGLANLNAVATAPSLAGALITKFTRMEMPPPEGTGRAVSPAYGDGPPAPIYGGLAPTAPIAYNGSTVGYLTGPTVGPGVAAFGATSAPVFPVPSPFTSPASFFNSPGMAGLNLGANGLGGLRGPVPRRVTYSFRNAEVLGALVKLTGQDFGYDVNAWKRWLRSDFKPEPAPARRVPQP